MQNCIRQDPDSRQAADTFPEMTGQLLCFCGQTHPDGTGFPATHTKPADGPDQNQSCGYRHKTRASGLHRGANDDLPSTVWKGCPLSFGHAFSSFLLDVSQNHIISVVFGCLVSFQNKAIISKNICQWIFVNKFLKLSFYVSVLSKLSSGFSSVFGSTGLQFPDHDRFLASFLSLFLHMQSTVALHFIISIDIYFFNVLISGEYFFISYKLY